MKISVQGRSAQGHANVARAGRFWPCGSAVVVDVLEQEDDPPPIQVEVRNRATNRMEKQDRPNPTVIGQATYRRLLDDARLVIKQTDTITQAAADAAMEAARAEVGRLSEENLKLKARVAELESGVSLKDALAKVAALEAAAKEPPADTGKKGKKGE